jgi:ankyrin repeat protein
MARFVAFGWKIGLGGSKVEGVNKQSIFPTSCRAVVILFVIVWSNLAFCGEIHNAAKAGNLEKIKALLKANPDLVNSKDRGGEVPLHWAIEKGNKEVVELLITCKADVNAKNERGETPLHWAVRSGRTEMVELLLANKAVVNAQDNNGWTPLDFATNPDNGVANAKATAELLRQHGGQNLGDPTNAASLFKAARYEHLEEVEELLKDNPALVAFKNYNGWTALDYASFYDHTNVAKLLLDNNADANAKDGKSYTPLQWAAICGHTDMAKLLLANKADVNAKNNDGNTPLHSAAFNDHKDVVELLLANKTEINAKNNKGETPLYVAASCNRKDIVELLLAKKAEVDAKNEAGWTPLYAVAFIGRKEIVELLLANGADVNAKDNGGWTPMRGAESNYDMGVANNHETEMKDMVELLRQHGGHE